MALPTPVFDGVIDVSHNNGAIDWKAVAGTGIALAFLKASEGTGFTDPLFVKNKAAAEAAGLMVVPYHFVDASDDPISQARFFMATAGLAEGRPAMLDWEVSGFSADQLAQLGYAVEGFTRRNPVYYYGWAQLSTPNPTLGASPLMLPEYPSATASGTYASLVTAAPRVAPGRPASRPYDFHQYTPAGQVSGIAGPVDRSVWVGTLDSLKAWFLTGAIPVS